MAFAGVLVDAEVKAALDGCSGELYYTVNYTVNALDSFLHPHHYYYY